MTGSSAGHPRWTDEMLDELADSVSGVKDSYHCSLFASQRMLAWQAFERGCLSWIQKFGISFGIARISFGIAGIGFRG
ncbi:MAG: hypothetical protein ACKPH1_00560 [Microcystis panniformis]|jgi:hypothetical protein